MDSLSRVEHVVGTATLAAEQFVQVRTRPSPLPRVSSSSSRASTPVAILRCHRHPHPSPLSCCPSVLPPELEDHVEWESYRVRRLACVP